MKRYARAIRTWERFELRRTSSGIVGGEVFIPDFICIYVSTLSILFVIATDPDQFAIQSVLAFISLHMRV